VKPGRCPCGVRNRGAYLVSAGRLEALVKDGGRVLAPSRVKLAEIGNGTRPGITTEDQQWVADLEREVRELRRANEILKAASAYFARELHPRLPR
jgi:transposase-like protein